MLLNLLISIIAVFVTAYLLPGVTVDNFWTVVAVAVVLGIANAIVRPILVFLTFPITLVTFGLFIFIINALMILGVSWLVPGFEIDSFWTALIFSVVLSLVTWFLRKLKIN